MDLITQPQPRDAAHLRPLAKLHHGLSRCIASLALAVLPLAAAAVANSSNTDPVVFGDTASEAAHRLRTGFGPVMAKVAPLPSEPSVTVASDLVHGALGQAARRLLPRTPAATTADDLDLLAQAYKTPWTTAYANPAVPGRLVEAFDAMVAAYSAAPDTCFRQKFTDRASNGDYRVRVKASGLVLEVQNKVGLDNASGVVVRPDRGDKLQLWRVTELAGAAYSLCAKALPSACLSVRDGSIARDAAVVLSPFTGAAHQQWGLTAP